MFRKFAFFVLEENNEGPDKVKVFYYFTYIQFKNSWLYLNIKFILGEGC